VLGGTANLCMYDYNCRARISGLCITHPRKKYLLLVTRVAAALRRRRWVGETAFWLLYHPPARPRSRPN
jgi:hypothetical protein